jgi:hypothetical protein
VFSGVGKRRDELERALQLNIRCFNVESEAELALLEQVAAERGQPAPVSLRINPDVDANTHPYISTGLKQNKFGVDPERALAIYAKAAASPHLRVVGMDCHIGSQLTQVTPFVDALERVLALAARLEAQGIPLHHLDLGGGLGIRYRDEQPPLPADHAAALMEHLRGKPYEILIEPGRAIIGNAGILVTRVQLLKHGDDKSFAVVDAAMNDLLRAGAVFGLAGDYSGGAAHSGRIALLRCGRADLRDRRFSWQGSGIEHRTGRFAGGAFRRRLRLRHEFQLQFSPACSRSDGGWRPVSGGALAGADRGLVRGRNGAGLKVGAAVKADSLTIF